MYVGILAIVKNQFYYLEKSTIRQINTNKHIFYMKIFRSCGERNKHGSDLHTRSHMHTRVLLSTDRRRRRAAFYERRMLDTIKSK